MTPGALLEGLIVAFQTFNFEQPADRFLNHFFKQRRYMGSSDRRFIAESFYQALKNLPLLDWWINRSLNQSANKMGNYPKDFPVARCRILALAQLYRKFSNIESLCNGQPYHPSTLNFAEKNLLAHLEHQQPLHPEMPLWVQLGVPEWLLPLLQKSLGKNYKEEIQALQQQASLDIRVNTLKVNREQVQEHLKMFEPIVTSFSPQGLRLQGRPPLASLEAYKKGWIEVQDEASQLIALLVDPQPKDWILDFCAGAGGKTLGLAALMKNKGRILATDTSVGRLKQAEERLRRAGVHCVQTKILDKEGLKWLSRHKGEFDRVLIDAPCTGSGTWRRNPDLKWRTTPESLKVILNIQQQLLSQAAALVKPQGFLIYVTCSLFEEENQQQIELFLKNNPSFSLDLFPETWHSFSSLPFPGKDFFETTPYRHQMDGFFAAKLKRQE